MNTKVKVRILGLLAVVLPGFVLASVANLANASGASEWARTDQAQVRLVSSAAATGGTQALRLGLHFVLQPGWKIYWRSPGDAGLPPRLDWKGSRNFETASVLWPAPERFELFGLDTFGYGDEVVLPIDARLDRAGAALSLKLGLDYLICEKICIPYEASLALDLPSGPPQATEYAQLIDRFSARVPRDGANVGLAIERVAWHGGGAPAISVIARAQNPFGNPDVYVEGPANGDWSRLGFGRPETTYSEDGKRAVLRIPVRAEAEVTANSSTFIGAPVTLTLVDGARAMEATLNLAAGLPTPQIAESGFIAILAIAFIGGLILNLMPCVLPVLSLKLIGFVGLSGAEHRRIRRNFVASASGIVASFLALAMALISLKMAGATIGWGIQFQQPGFLAFMAVVLAAFAANLWGWFEIRLPALSVGPGRVPHEESVAGAFFTGVLATLLATPCSAPFVGTGVGFALARGPGEILAVFLMLGLGLALPYLAVAVFPSLAAHLPRPGLWMTRLRAILGLALAATAIWLLTVITAQLGISAASVIAALLLVLLALLWAMRHRQGVLVSAVVVVAAVSGIVLPGRFSSPAYLAVTARPDGPAWQKFDLSAVETLVLGGRVVFVDVTADWCITCQVNKTAVVSRGTVADRLADGSVVPMRADWTRPDPAIARYLASFGRYGIPFNVVYGPGAPAGIVMPEILTADAVLEAFRRAQGGS
jgi:suppressor for copper-sensitivity B